MFHLRMGWLSIDSAPKCMLHHHSSLNDLLLLQLPMRR